MTARRRRACARAPKRCRPCFRRSRRADARKVGQELTEKPTMRRSQRLIAATILIALSGALAGCGSMGNFDPTDMLDFLDTKKKLPGERKPVFPDGVPGLEQGVPKELYKGARQQQIDRSRTRRLRPPPRRRRRSRNRRAPRNPRASRRRPPPARRPRHEPAAADPDAAPEEEGGTAAAPPAPQAQEDRAQAHHRAAARPAGRAIGARLRHAATIRRAVPGAAAERHLSRVKISSID